MASALLPSFTLLVALAASLTWRPAPHWAGVWKLAIAMGEFGHWLVLLPVTLAVLAWVLLTGWLGAATLVLAAVAAAALLRPAISAARLAQHLPRELSAAFGCAAGADGIAWSWRRAYFPPRLRRVVVTTEVLRASGGEELSLDFYRASDVAADRAARPCLVVVHGGGWDGGDRTQLAEWNHHWAARGYAVAAISYRLAPAHQWPAPREDTLAAIAWLKENAARLGIAATRLVLVGRSAGGQIATAAAYDAQDPAICGVVSLYAPQDMEFAWSVSREDDTLNSINLMRQYLGGPPDTPERRAVYHSASAQKLAGPASPPTLLLHGTPDTLVWYRHSERMVAHLRAVGVPHHYLALPWATHGFDFNRHGPGGQLADYAIAMFLQRVTAE
ncbi:MAG: alpha/beta hydrolase [Candidatus Didemnitutus sp.]|nr:alpha/beta hydrolase [Candidatus Didemnitutus sp.]